MAGEPQPQPQAASPLGSTCETWLDRKRPPGATQASALPKARLKPAAAAFVLSPVLWSSREEVGWGTDFLGTPSGITANLLPISGILEPQPHHSPGPNSLRLKYLLGVPHVPGGLPDAVNTRIIKQTKCSWAQPGPAQLSKLFLQRPESKHVWLFRPPDPHQNHFCKNSCGRVRLWFSNACWPPKPGQCPYILIPKCSFSPQSFRNTGSILSSRQGCMENSSAKSLLEKAINKRNTHGPGLCQASFSRSWT